MLVNIKRFEHSSVEGNRGIVLIDGKFFGFSIECPELFNRVNESRIPAGVYEVIKVDSEDRGHVWLVKNVVNRSGIILFHKGNTKRSFKGCIGLGENLVEAFPMFDGERGVSNTTAKCKEFEELTKSLNVLTLIIENV